MGLPARASALPGTALLLGAVLGPALQLQQAALWPWQGYVSLLAIGVALLSVVALHWSGALAGTSAVRLASPARWVGALAAAAMVAAAVCGLRASAQDAHHLLPQLEGRDIDVVGVVAAMPQRSDVGLRLRLAVESAQSNGQPVKLPPQVLLSWYGGVWNSGDGALDLMRTPAALGAGERWRMTVRLKAPHGQMNPHGFDYELWLWEQGIQATGYVRATARDTPPQRLSPAQGHWVERARQAVRDAVLNRISGPADDSADASTDRRRVAGVVAALVTGDQAAIERADWDVFRATGVAHLMSISGLHITLFAWLTAAFVNALWRRSARLCLWLPAQTVARALGVLAALAYALFSGWGVPAQRTVWMLATVTLLTISGRRWPWPQVWLLTLAVVTTLDPWALLQAGFWLSFVAVGVLFASDAGKPASPPAHSTPAHTALQHGSEQLPPAQSAPLAALGSLWQRLAGVMQAMLREQVLMTLALAPLTLLLFGQISLVGLLANLLAIPWVTGVVTPLALLGVLVPPLWDAAAWAVQLLGDVLGAMAQWSLAVLWLARAPLWAGVLGVLGGVLLVLRLPPALRLAGLPLLVPLLLWQVPRPAPGQFDLLAADIGQGNALLLRTATHSLVYDAGPRYSLESDAGYRVLVPLLRALGERVDTLVLSHRDSDHTGGAQAVLTQQPQAQVLSSLEVGHELQALRPVQRCMAGQSWDWDGVRFEVLHPQAHDYAVNAKPNAMSCVLRVSNGRAAVLLVGDIEQAQEARLVQTIPQTLHADVLLVPHHGSKTSSSEAFLDAVQPRLALVQAGYRNRFGHPAPAVLARYEARAVRVVNSSSCGAAQWASERPEQVLCQRELARRYWHHQR